MNVSRSDRPAATLGSRLIQLFAVLLAVAYVGALVLTWLAYSRVGEAGIFRGTRSQQGPDRLVILDVVPDSPLAQTGVMKGDAIVAIDGQPLTDDLMWEWASRRPGDRETLEVAYGAERSGRLIFKSESVTVTLGSRMEMPTFIVTLIVYSIVGLMAVLVSAALGVLRPRERAAQLLMLGEMAYAYALLFDLWGTMGVYVIWLTQAFFLIFTIGTVALLHLSLTFPIKSPVLAAIERFGPRPLQRIGGGTLLGYALPLAVTVALTRWPVVQSYPIIGMCIVLLLIAIVALFRNYRRATTEIAKAQLRWMMLGLIVGVTGWILGPETGLPLIDPGLWPIAVTVGAWVVFPIALAMAILRYRLFDIDVIINRSLVYGLLTATLGAVYFGGVVLLQPVFQSLTYGSNLTIAISTLATALLFNPLRERIQEVIDRRFYRHRYDTARTLSAFGAAVRDEVDLNRLTQDLLWVVHETMEPAHISVWLAPSVEALPAHEQSTRRLAA